MYEQGYNDALSLLGVEKTAGVRSGLLGAGRWLRSKLPTAKGVKEFFVGQPKQFWSEVRSGKALDKGSLIRRSMTPQGKLDKALFIGLPAYEMARTTFDDRGNKAERLGRQAGGNLFGLAAWKPLGMVGAMGAGMLGDTVGGSVGRGVGRGIDRLSGKTSQKPSEKLKPYVY